MSIERLTLNGAIVLGSGLAYWLSVGFQVLRVRRRIGHSPNVRPRGRKEKLLWLGWVLVVIAWLVLPWLGGSRLLAGWAVSPPPLLHQLGLALGTTMMIVGYATTLWCYRAMGDAWRMGVNRGEPTQFVTKGPYRFVRHPIYLAQLLMVAAIAILLPSVLSLATLAIHLACVLTKAADEESHLRNQLGETYEIYRARSGAWFPRWRRGKPRAEDSPGLARNPLKPVDRPL